MKTIPFLALFLVLLAASARGQINISSDGSPAHPTAMLEVKSSDHGFLPPRVTGAQRDAIAMPAEGLIVICTDCRAGDSAAISVFLNGSWKVLGGYCRTPAIPAPGSSMAGTTQITWAWLAVPGARGYRWNTVNNFSTATEMGTALAKTENGLTGGTMYHRFVWAYNDCGISVALPLSVSTVY